MPRDFAPCRGLPHPYDPDVCEQDWQQYLAESEAETTTMGQRDRQRRKLHDDAQKQLVKKGGGN
jgi:hypothetical protein